MSFAETRSPTLKSSVATQAESVRRGLRELNKALQEFRRARHRSSSQDSLVNEISRIRQMSQESQESLRSLEAFVPESKLDRNIKANLVKQLGKELETLLEAIKHELEVTDNEDRKEVAEVTEQIKHEEMLSALAFEESLLQDRSNEIKSIETSLVEIQDIIRDTGVMVAEQGESLDRIDSYVGVTEKETSKAVLELEKSETYQRKSNSRTRCILIVVVVLLTVVIVIASVGSS